MSTDPAIELQAKFHPLEFTGEFRSIEEYVIHLMHMKAYEEAAIACDSTSVLDLGCNNGWGSVLLRQRAARVVGLDVSQSALDDANRRFGNSGVEFMRYDGRAIPFEDDTFDRVVSFQVIEHVENMTAYLGEIARVLRPDGRALFTTPNAAIRLDSGMKPWNIFHVREYRPGDLYAALKPAFGHVAVHGLFAAEELYRIEYERCQNALASARERLLPRRPSRLAVAKRAAREAVKTCLPKSVVELLRTGINRGANGNGASLESTLAQSLLDKYSTKDLFYRHEDIAQALDLMAICENPVPQAQ